MSILNFQKIKITKFTSNLLVIALLLTSFSRHSKAEDDLISAAAGGPDKTIGILQLLSGSVSDPMAGYTILAFLAATQLPKIMSSLGSAIINTRVVREYLTTRGSDRARTEELKIDLAALAELAKTEPERVARLMKAAEEYGRRLRRVHSYIAFLRNSPEFAPKTTNSVLLEAAFRDWTERGSSEALIGLVTEHAEQLMKPQEIEFTQKWAPHKTNPKVWNHQEVSKRFLTRFIHDMRSEEREHQNLVEERNRVSLLHPHKYRQGAVSHSIHGQERQPGLTLELGTNKLVVWSEIPNHYKESCATTMASVSKSYQESRKERGKKRSATLLLLSPYAIAGGSALGAWAFYEKAQDKYGPNPVTGKKEEDRKTKNQDDERNRAEMTFGAYLATEEGKQAVEPFVKIVSSHFVEKAFAKDSNFFSKIQEQWALDPKQTKINFSEKTKLLNNEAEMHDLFRRSLELAISESYKDLSRPQVVEFLSTAAHNKEMPQFMEELYAQAIDNFFKEISFRFQVKGRHAVQLGASSAVDIELKALVTSSIPKFKSAGFEEAMKTSLALVTQGGKIVIPPHRAIPRGKGVETSENVPTPEKKKTEPEKAAADVGFNEKIGQILRPFRIFQASPSVSGAPAESNSLVRKAP